MRLRWVRETQRNVKEEKYQGLLDAVDVSVEATCQETTLHQIMIRSFVLRETAYENPTSCFPMADDTRQLMRMCGRCGTMHDINGRPESCPIHKSFLRVTVPGKLMGQVIGKDGSTIKEILSVSKVFQHPGTPTKKPELWFQGGPDEIDKAFKMVNNILAGRGTVVGMWDCCKKDSTVAGCTSKLGHDTKTYYPFFDQSLVVTTKPMARPGKVFALDCETVLTDKGKEVAMVTLLNFEGKICFESLVKPSLGIQDYNTKYSGISPEMLNKITTSLKDVQKGLLRLISSEDVLVGHVLENDLRALHMEHGQVIVSPKRSSPSIWPGC